LKQPRFESSHRRCFIFQSNNEKNKNNWAEIEVQWLAKLPSILSKFKSCCQFILCCYCKIWK